MIGRIKEQEMLLSFLQDEKSHFVAVYGRRRIGKTFLIREVYANRFTFQHSGLYAGNRKNQLFAFASSLRDAGYDCKKIPSNWLAAFENLKDLIRNSNEKKKIVFIDELSWMDTAKSDLMMALENFWNGFASARKDVILIVCASATSWMLSNVVHNKGGLYNRLTEQIHLGEFDLNECEQYVQKMGLAWNRNQILQYYMIFGGVPYYWSFILKGQSLSQCVDRILFEKEAPLREEYTYLYASIFRKPEIYLRIIETLSEKKSGMTREEIIHASGIVNSGDLSKKLEELESCGFIRCFYAFGKKKKNAMYQLIDNFTLFYYQFIKQKPTDEHFWSNQINTPVINTWAGLAFERVCLKHIKQIKEKLGISGVLTEENSWYCEANPDSGIWGSQIDLLIARKDQVINLCEMKYSLSEYTITSKIEHNIQHKISDLRQMTNTKDAIFPTLVTTYGLVENTYSDVIQSIVVLDDLFR